MPASTDTPAVRLLFGGDAMLGRGVNRVVQKQGPASPLAPIAPVARAADAFFVNLECAITPRQIRFSGAEKAFYFRADPPAVQTLTHAGVDAVSLANNHALDADYDGLRDTLRLLDAHGIAHAGAGTDLEAARAPAVLDVGSRRVGLLAYCDHQADFAATADRPGIRYVDLARGDAPDALAGEVEALAARVDLVVAAFHWQPNWVPRVAPLYRHLGRRLVEAGATVVWGHSPHHFQGVERIDGGTVLYSTGGLVDDYALNDRFRNDRQLLFEVRASEGGTEGVHAFPIALDYARTHPATGEARAWIVRRLAAWCDAVGSRIEDRGDWLAVHPA